MSEKYLLKNYKNFEIYIQELGTTEVEVDDDEFEECEVFNIIIKNPETGVEIVEGPFETPYYGEVIEDVIEPMIDKM